MKKKLFKLSNTFYYFFAIYIIFSLKVGAQDLPKADIELLFEQDWNATIKNTGTSGTDAFWFTYRGGEPQYGGIVTPASPKHGRSALFSGYHNCCPPDLHTSALDILLMGGGFKNYPQVKKSVFNEEMQGFTLAFWYKTIRDYSCATQACETNPVICMAEEEILFKFGATNGISIKNFGGYPSVKITGTSATNTNVSYTFDNVINSNFEVADKTKWQHVAVTLDPTTHQFSFYLDGELAVQLSDVSNCTLPTQIVKIAAQDSTSAIFGAHHDASVDRFLPGFWPLGATESCLTGADANKFRTGWPYAGYMDDLRFFKNIALTKSQIQAYMNLVPTLVEVPQNYNKRSFVYPNPSGDIIHISNIKAKSFNVTVNDINGKEVMKAKLSQEKSSINIANLKSGIYFININDGKQIVTEKIIKK